MDGLGKHLKDSVWKTFLRFFYLKDFPNQLCHCLYLAISSFLSDQSTR